MTFEEIKKEDSEKAIELLNVYISNHPQDDNAYMERGLKYWSLNKRKEAINDYLAALKINPESRAKMALDFANSILEYYNKDLYNP